MAGDINVFLSWEEEEEEEENKNEAEADKKPRRLLTGELNVMTAEERSRGKGLAKEALGLMTEYAASRLGVQRFVAKILDSNTTSLKLFRSIGFRDYSHSSVFEETTLIYEPPSSSSSETQSQTSSSSSSSSTRHYVAFDSIKAL